jgi:hypothetical protein
MIGGHLTTRTVEPKLSERFMEISHGAQQDLDSAIRLIGGDSLTHQDVAGLADERSHAYLREMIKYMADVLTPALERFAYTKVASTPTWENP